MAVNKKNGDFRSLIFPLGFAAPELILNKIDLINPTTDYFALGITIYRLWAGKLPLAHPNPSVFTNLQLAHPIPSDSSMPKQLNEWILHVCAKPHWRTAPNLMSEEEVDQRLQKSFEQRYTSSVALIEAIEQVKEKEPEKKTIVGKWTFEWNKQIGVFSPEKLELKNDSTFNLLQFFGAEMIDESTGKWIEFTVDNKIMTDWLEQDQIDKVKFGYEMNEKDTLLIFSAVSPRKSTGNSINRMILS